MYALRKHILPILVMLSLGSGTLIQQWRTCVRVIDGDTVVLDGNEKVRLIGIDSPELNDPRVTVRQLAQNCYEFARSIIEGRRVRLEYDKDRVDKYGRTLAYIYLEDGTFFNAEMVKQGFAYAYVKYPFKHIDDFRRYEQEARQNSRGLWADGIGGSKAIEKPASPAGVDSKTIVYITRSGTKYHIENCRSLSKSKIPITLGEAIQKGYTPCSICKPPVLGQMVEKPQSRIAEASSADITVYVTRTGSKYHTASCSSLRRSRIPMKLKDACAAGYTPCSRCNPPRCK
jgi:micrococcal nuclease